MLENLKRQVYEANCKLLEYGLVIFTWGNVSAIDRESGLIVIKPSGVEYSELLPEKMTIVDLNGKIIEGALKPSSDTPTHIELYKSFKTIGGITHTHSSYATSFAQALTSVKPYGTTHADYFYGEVPCTRILTADEIKEDYEKNTGMVIAEAFKDKDETAVPGVLVANHGPFCWGKDAQESVYHAKVLEEVAKTAIMTRLINSGAEGIGQYILDKHYFRKHGKSAYYGQ